jgi:hypothetical protein
MTEFSINLITDYIQGEMRGKKIIILLGALASGVAPAQLVASPRRSTPPPARPSSSFSTNHRRRRGDAATPLLVATVNGALHALDERTGQPRWTLVTGGALLASYQANGTVKAMLPTASGDLLELSGGGDGRRPPRRGGACGGRHGAGASWRPGHRT